MFQARSCHGTDGWFEIRCGRGSNQAGCKPPSSPAPTIWEIAKWMLDQTRGLSPVGVEWKVVLTGWNRRSFSLVSRLRLHFVVT